MGFFIVFFSVMSAKTYPNLNIYYFVRKEYFEIWFDYLGAELTRKKDVYVEVSQCTTLEKDYT